MKNCGHLGIGIANGVTGVEEFLSEIDYVASGGAFLAQDKGKEV